MADDLEVRVYGRDDEEAVVALWNSSASINRGLRLLLAFRAVSSSLRTRERRTRSPMASGSTCSACAGSTSSVLESAGHKVRDYSLTK
jgi:hypothetical protein